MLPPKYLSATKPRRSWAPDLRGLDGALSGEPDAALGEGAADSEFFHQRFRNFLYVEFAGPRKTLLKLRNLCLDWLQPETRTKEEIIELLVLEQYLTILPEKIKPWVRAKKPENCEKLVSLLENYKEMYEPEGEGEMEVAATGGLGPTLLLSGHPGTAYDSSSDVHSDSSMSRNTAESPPRAAYSFRGDRDRDWDQDWDRDRDQDWDLEQDRVRDREHRRGRSRDLESRGRWPYARNPRSRFPQRDLSLPLTEQSTLAEEGEHRRRDSLLDCEARPQDAVSYQDVVDLAEDRQPQNPVQDNMENYRKLLSLGVQLAEDDGHSHMTQGHSSRSKRSAYPSSSRGEPVCVCVRHTVPHTGLKTMPETKKSTHRRGICEDESSHGVIMEKFIRDVPRSPKSGRARGPGDRVQRFSRRADSGWKDVPFSKRESVIQERGYEGSAFGGGGFNFNSNLVSRKRVLERKRRYHFDTDGKGSVHNQKGCARKRPFECSEVRRAVSMSSLSAPPLPDSQPFDLGAMPYVCDECGRPFSVISEFVEHQIMHTRESLYEYGESFLHSVAVSEVRRRQVGGKRFECKECGETFNKSAALAEHRQGHSRGRLAGGADEECEEPFMASPTFRELQKIYGKDKFYECRVCGETFLHSSALVEHQQVHGRGGREDGRREARRPVPALGELPKTRGSERRYECRVCGEAFLHGAALRGHQRAHAHSPLSSQGRGREEAFTPGPSLKKRQKTYSREKPYDFKDPGEAFKRQSPGLTELQKIHSRKNLYEGRGCPKSAIHSAPFPEPQKSHTITRPPEDEEAGSAFAVSASPADRQEALCRARKPYERSVIHSLSFAGAQKSHSAAGPATPEVVPESPLQGSGVIRRPKVLAREGITERKRHETSVIHSLATFRPPRSCSGSEVTGRDERGESSAYLPDLRGQQQKTPARENPYRGSKTPSFTESVIHSVSHSEPRTSLAGEGSSGFKKDGEPSGPSSGVREHQKARAKKKNIEQRNYETSPPLTLRPVTLTSQLRPVVLTSRLKLVMQTSRLRPVTQTSQLKPVTPPSRLTAQTSYADQLAQTSYAEPPAQTSYTDQLAQTSYADQPAQTSYVDQPMRNECKDCGECFATTEDLGAHQKIYAQEKFHSGKLFGDSVIQGVSLDGPQQEEPRQDEPEEPEEPDDEQEEAEDSIYGCKDCGLGFADRADLRDHQRVHGREYVVDSREHTRSVSHAHPFGELQKDYLGEQLYECPACGESFVHSSFLFEHQRVHEQDQFYGRQRYDEPFVQPLVISPPRPRVPQKSPPAGLSLQCQVCGRDFIHGSVLSQHVSVHTAEGLPERGQRSRGAVGAGSALAELQRDPAEERRYQCETCGESFPSPSDLREHVKAHESEEPYDYGAAFVHTSFLTEPPKGDSPFYECKDCGKSFLHSTVLTKHQKLHAEEEEAAAAAQEVEANVLVPREVLRIQGSNVEAAEPEVEAAEPEVEAAEPNVEAAEPNGEAEGPDGEAAEPNGEAEQPNGEAEQPNGDADEPDGAGIEDPEERAEEPEGDADEPDGAGVEDPEEEVEDPEIQVEEPYYDCRECGETFTSSVAYGEHLKTHARVIIFEAGNVCGESSHYTEHASTSTGDSGRADDKHFTCDVCGQVFGDRLSLARHQNTHTG
ncbi:paternally-expressed gene 3 protein-like isoform 2 [Camelus ferus]|nr:paternally-expressed gene 3 protein-like isoform 2 [Camelus ferus]